MLAFANRSANADDEYFSDGLADELLNMLAKIEGLRWPRARRPLFQGQGRDRVRNRQDAECGHRARRHRSKSGNRARISVQLVKVDDGYQIWSRILRPHAGDIFAVQDDIAQAVVTELRQRLLERRAGRQDQCRE